jgi:hypothetical protein
VGSVGLAGDFHDDRPVEHAIRQGQREVRVTQILAPGSEIDVGDQDCRTLLSATVDPFIEQTGRLGSFLTLQSVEAKFINDQQIQARIFAETSRQRLVRHRSAQFFQQLGAGCVAYAPPRHAGLMADRLDQMTLPNSALSQQNQVFMPEDELARRQFSHA